MDELKTGHPEGLLLRLGGATFDQRKRVLSYKGSSVQLSGREAQLLSFLMYNPDRYFTAQQLLRGAWDAADHSPEEVRVYVRRLRQKVVALSLPLRLSNQKWLGYCLTMAEDQPGPRRSLARRLTECCRQKLAAVSSRPQATEPLPLAWAGLAGLVGVCLTFVDPAMQLMLHRPPAAPLSAAATDGWHLPGLFAIPMLALGWVAVYARQAEWAGRIGALGFLLGFATLVGGWPLLVHLFLGPFVLAQDAHAITVLDAEPPLSRLPMLALFGLSLGLVLTGLATWRARVFPAWTGWTLAAAGLVSLFGELSSLPVFGFAGGIAARLVLASLSYAVWSGTSRGSRAGWRSLGAGRTAGGGARG